MSNDFKQEIIDHALRSPENLSLAIRVAKAFDDIRKRLITEFVKELLNRLQTKLPEQNGWKIEADSLINAPFITYSGLSIYNNNWLKKMSVLIETEAPNARYIGFVFTGNESTELSEEKKIEIKTELEKKYGKSKRGGPNTIWYRDVHPDLMHWDSEVALLKIQNGEAAEYFSKELVNLAKLVDSICNKKQTISPDTQDSTNNPVEINSSITSENK